MKKLMRKWLWYFPKSVTLWHLSSGIFAAHFLKVWSSSRSGAGQSWKSHSSVLCRLHSDWASFVSLRFALWPYKSSGHLSSAFGYQRVQDWVLGSPQGQAGQEFVSERLCCLGEIPNSAHSALSLNLSPPGHGRPPWWEAWVLRQMARDPGRAFRLSDWPRPGVRWPAVLRTWTFQVLSGHCQRIS